MVSHLFDIAQAHPPGDGTFHSGWGLPTDISNQENAPQVWPTSQSDGDNSSAGVPSPQLTLVCVKFTQTNRRWKSNPNLLSKNSFECHTAAAHVSRVQYDI